MSDDDFRDKIAAINAEFDQFRAAMLEIATAVSDYRKKLKQGRQFNREEHFMLTMEFQTMILSQIMNMGGNNEPQIPDFPPED